MNNPLDTALIVSGIGMALLFLALTVLYGLMYLMTAVTRERGPEESPAAEPERMGRRRAAVIGVALARAEAETTVTGPLPAEESSLSPWQAYHRHRLLGLYRPATMPHFRR